MSTFKGRNHRRCPLRAGVGLGDPEFRLSHRLASFGPEKKGDRHETHPICWLLTVVAVGLFSCRKCGGCGSVAAVCRVARSTATTAVRNSPMQCRLSLSRCVATMSAVATAARQASDRLRDAAVAGAVTYPYYTMRGPRDLAQPATAGAVIVFRWHVPEPPGMWRGILSPIDRRRDSPLTTTPCGGASGTCHLPRFTCHAKKDERPSREPTRPMFVS